MQTRRRRVGWLLSVALVGIGVVTVAWACLSTVKPATPAIVADAFVPPPAHLFCGTLIDSHPPINPDLASKSFPDSADQATWQQVVASANSTCQSARRTQAIGLAVGAGLAILGLGTFGWLLRRREVRPRTVTART